MNKVRITETVTRGMRKTLSTQRKTAGLKAGGKGLIDFLKRHFAKKDQSEPNQLGGDRTHFWLQIGRSVEESPTIEQGRVRIPIRDKRFPQKLYGGQIVPKRAKALTIPIHPAAHGRSAAQVSAKVGGLFILKTKAGEAFLAGKVGKVVTLYYLLKRRVFQAPWPGTLPPDRSMKWVLTYWIGRYYKDLFKKASRK
jgi:hypothetical protein